MKLLHVANSGSGFSYIQSRGKPWRISPLKSQITTTRGGGLFLLVLEGTLFWALRNNYFPAEKHNLLLSDGFAYGNQKIARLRQFCWSVPCLHIIEG